MSTVTTVLLVEDHRLVREAIAETLGKEADLMLVDGDVSKELGALRRVVTVVSDGFVMDADALRKAAGYSGRPK